MGWYVHQAGLSDLRQLVPRRVPDEGDVPLTTEHVDELLQQSHLLIHRPRQRGLESLW